MQRIHPGSAALVASVLIGICSGSIRAADQDLAGYFGFTGLEVVKIGRNCGPVIVADVNGDGHNDIIAVNNRSSRIEVHYQSLGASPDDPPRAAPRLNEFPEHWRYRREMIPVVHRVAAVLTHDYDGDGLTDLVYAGLPGEIVFLKQVSAGVFETARRHRVRGLSANRNAFAVADLLGDSGLELVSVVRREIFIWALDGDRLSTPMRLPVGRDVVGFIIDDLSGNGVNDLAAILPDDPAPIRFWPGGLEGGDRTLGAQLRFEMPALVEADIMHLPNEAAARLVTIERATRRLVVHEVASVTIEPGGDREAALRVRGFTDPERERDHAVADIDGDGLLDLVTTDDGANALALYRQREGKGLLSAETFPTLSRITHLVAGNVDDDAATELFVLSEEEGVVGRCDYTIGADGVSGAISFPVPLPVPVGRTPTALSLVDLDGVPHVAVVAKEGRDYEVIVLDLEGGVRSVPLGKLSRSPDGLVAVDADQDGHTDLLAFTKGKPMTMLHSVGDGYHVHEGDDMGQFGLVKAASSENTAVHDIDGDGRPELLIAEKNFVRAVRYDPHPAPGVSAGWQVAAQINADDPTAKLVSIAQFPGRLVVADSENDRLVVMTRDEGSGRWAESDALAVRGFSFGPIHAGAFAGDGQENLLAIGSDGFAVVRLGGLRTTLKEMASWRPDDERRIPHELAWGDLNADGYSDLVSLDAGEQMCEILTFSAAQRLLYATGFQVFESRIFSGAEAREFEPSQAIVSDVTGDGASDLILLAHDRLLIYPQMAGE